MNGGKSKVKKTR